MKTALILFADGSEELEAVTVINILRRGGVEVTLAGLHEGPHRGSRGTVLVPDVTLNEALKHGYDMVVLPGGQPGSNHLKADARVLKLVRQMSEAGKHVAAICAAPSVLAEAGLLDGKRATCFPTCLDEYPKVKLQAAAVVEDGNIVTSRGPGTAMDFALVLVERLVGHAKRQEVEAGLVR
ncbi:MAG: 4-methyl-5(B-hydroxyethyl)-thiazole monophosphate biosynthesis protein [Gallionellales bacterium GWA2_59_43]|nr:MAG: 4-methyl-5(B-hydroxyethyl)-thiazole monophosphate biosynthesis protein [Gallionellales bacterium GWA2_59_43]